MTGTQKLRNRNGKVELLRFIFAVMIVLNHSRYAVGDANCSFLGCSFAAEFFFLLSGYLMMHSVSRISTPPDKHLGRETVQFLRKKVRSMWPEALIAWIISSAVYYKAYMNGQSMTKVIDFLKVNIWELLFLGHTGLINNSVNSAIWFVSSMLLCMAFMYPLLRRHTDMMSRVVFPLAAVLIMGYFAYDNSTLRDPSKWLGWTYKGNLRTVALLGVGVAAYPFAQHLRRLKMTRFGRIFLTVAEPIMYFSVLYFMCTEKASLKDYYYILIMTLALIITFSGQTYLEGKFNNAFMMFLGRFSIPLYFGHFIWSRSIGRLRKDLPVDQRMWLYLGVSLLSATFIYVLSALIRRWKVREKLVGLFVAKG